MFSTTRINKSTLIWSKILDRRHTVTFLCVEYALNGIAIRHHRSKYDFDLLTSRYQGSREEIVFKIGLLKIGWHKWQKKVKILSYPMNYEPASNSFQFRKYNGLTFCLIKFSEKHPKIGSGTGQLQKEKK